MREEEAVLVALLVFVSITAVIIVTTKSSKPKGYPWETLPKGYGRAMIMMMTTMMIMMIRMVMAMTRIA